MMHASINVLFYIGQDKHGCIITEILTVSALGTRIMGSFLKLLLIISTRSI